MRWLRRVTPRVFGEHPMATALAGFGALVATVVALVLLPTGSPGQPRVGAPGVAIGDPAFVPVVEAYTRASVSSTSSSTTPMWPRGSSASSRMTSAGLGASSTRPGASGPCGSA